MASVPRTRIRAAVPVAPPPAEPPQSRIRRHAQPRSEPAQPERRPVRLRPPSLPSAAVSGLVTGVVELERSVNGQPMEAVHEIVHAPRRLPDGTFTPAMVRVGAGATLRPREFEAVRIMVELTLPCFPDQAGIDGAYAEAAAWVEAKVQEQMQSVTSV